MKRLMLVCLMILCPWPRTATKQCPTVIPCIRKALNNCCQKQVP